jgi:hypothetical protein
LVNPVGFRGHEESGKVEEIGFWRGEFKVWDEGIDEGEGFAAGGFFGGEIRIE